MFVAYIDGGSRGNPGLAGYGVRIEHHDGTLCDELHGAVGVTTNNAAEYHGLIAALRYLVTHEHREARIRSDSQLLIRQMRGEYRVRHHRLRPLHQQARQLVARLDRVVFEHVPRASNTDADRLANVAMDEAEADTAAETGAP